MLLGVSIEAKACAKAMPHVPNPEPSSMHSILFRHPSSLCFITFERRYLMPIFDVRACARTIPDGHKQLCVPSPSLFLFVSEGSFSSRRNVTVEFNPSPRVTEATSSPSFCVGFLSLPSSLSSM